MTERTHPMTRIDTMDNVEHTHQLHLAAMQSIHPEHFYLTGYETLAIQKEREYLLESVLSSVVSFDREVLILKLSDKGQMYATYCEKHQIQYRMMEVPDGEVNFMALEEMLMQSRRLSHVLVSVDLLQYGEHLIHRLGKLIQGYRRSMIVDCVNQPISLQQMFHYQVDFMISSHGQASDQSLVIARRSKLVQTEGNGRKGTLDLYSFWQSTVQRRGATIEPMSA